MYYTFINKCNKGPNGQLKWDRRQHQVKVATETDQVARPSPRIAIATAAAQ
jgi:hypothetical protein